MVKKLVVQNPYDLSVLAELDWHSVEEIENKIFQAKQNFNPSSPRLSVAERISILQKTMTLMESQKEMLAMLIAQEGGKPYKDAVVEVVRAINGVQLAIEGTGQIKGQEIPMNLNAASMDKKAWTIRQPLGLVLAISAFNHPLNLIIHQVIPAIAVGCPVLVKPALTTPLSCLKLVELLYEAGLPQDLCQVVLCSDAMTEEMAKDSRWGLVSFIGSAKIGWKLKSQLAPGVQCILEHGGVAPVIVDKAADVDAMIPKLIKGAFYHSGQVCVSVQRLYVPKSMSEDICQKLLTEIELLKTGPATEQDSDLGPIVRRSALQRIDSWVKEAVAEGAELLCGGQLIGESCYAPTVLLSPSEESIVSKEEIFGPVLCVYTYDDLAEVIERANALPYCFQASFFSQNLTQSLSVAECLKGTAVMINDHTAFRVDWMPFGGREKSGYGIGGIVQTMEKLCVEKLIVFA